MSKPSRRVRYHPEYVDVPVYATPRVLVVAVQEALGQPTLAFVKLGEERVRANWVRPKP